MWARGPGPEGLGQRAWARGPEPGGTDGRTNIPCILQDIDFWGRWPKRVSLHTFEFNQSLVPSFNRPRGCGLKKGAIESVCIEDKIPVYL